MAKNRALRKEETERKSPVNIGDRAIDNLKFIRETMERSTAFTAVPGYGGVLMGATAIGASVVASRQADLDGWLIVWLAEAALAFAIGLLAMWQKSKLIKTSLLSQPARKFAFGFLPPLACGVVLTLALYRFGAARELFVGAWLLLYGAAVASGGMFSVKIVPIVGWLFITLGAVAFFVDGAAANWLMAVGFGGFQIVFGLIIARKFGG